MAKTNRDIEYEMSKFEEEITKLIPSTEQPKQMQSTTQIKTSRIQIQIPSSIPNVTKTYAAPFNYAAGSAQKTQPPPPPLPPSMFIPPPPNPFNQLSYEIPSNLKPHSITQKDIHLPPGPPPPSSKPSSTSGIKRDASSLNTTPQVPAKAPKIVPTTAAAAAQSVAAAAASTAELDKKNKTKEAKDKKKKSKFIRAAAGQTWEDESLIEWDPDDFRLFCGDLGNEVNDESLARAFQKYTSFQKAKVIRDKRTGKTKGYGFVSFKSSEDFIKAMREMDGKYVGNRPIKLRKSNWKDRNLDAVRRKEAEKQKMGLR